ncbi:hypothetical protein N5079_24885 [Planotetraspora sp. A-T 1434]|uniref:hypothetical protein n=1 Tax=Planotetraspora sp. A-T 1434 TaxID=2979219 RepID=UPI0021BF8953|nr:hypothetical protein [Planotetraspora sp. A-T 1434]MCT9933455.1 hypothetical protein [Planotetraspora sp. A-T 1434]
MEPITASLLGVYALSQAAGHVMNWYKGKRDGSWREQQDYLAKVKNEQIQRSHENLLSRDRENYERSLRREREATAQRERDAALAHERTLERDRQLAADRAEEATIAYGRALERDAYLSKLRVEEAELALERSEHLAIVQARLQLETQRELQRRTLEQANSPFAEPLEKIRERVEERTGGGSVPAVIIAPFHDAEPGAVVKADLGIRQALRTAAWAQDVEIFGGLVNRPLIWTDTDIQTIRMLLHDLPVVLVQGQVQAGARAWVSMTAWNLGDTSGTRVVDVDFPPMMLPGVEEGRPATTVERLAFEDHVSGLVTLTTGAYAEWFHILKSGRPPKLHTMLPDQYDAERSVLAANSAALYEICAERGLVTEDRSRLTQAVVLAEGGHTARAVDLVRAGLPALGSALAGGAHDPELADLLSRLIALVEDGTDEETRRMFHMTLEELRRQAVLYRLGWGEAR